MNVIMTIEQYEKIRRLLDFADYYLDDYPRDSFPEQYESDREEITQAQEVLQFIDECLLNDSPKFEPATEEL